MPVVLVIFGAGGDGKDSDYSTTLTASTYIGGKERNRDQFGEILNSEEND